MEQNKNPWKTKKITKVYENPWITLTHEDVIIPSGNDGIYGKVHFKNYAVGIIPIDQDGNTWLVGQYRYTLDAYSWEIPEGGALIPQDPLKLHKKN
jgi:ADP-ribose pyrophosphatase